MTFTHTKMYFYQRFDILQTELFNLAVTWTFHTQIEPNRTEWHGIIHIQRIKYLIFMYFFPSIQFSASRHITNKVLIQGKIYSIIERNPDSPSQPFLFYFGLLSLTLAFDVVRFGCVFLVGVAFCFDFMILAQPKMDEKWNWKLGKWP